MSKVPATLRWGLAFAVLRGDFYELSMTYDPSAGALYRFTVKPRAVRGWLKRNKRLRDQRHRLVNVENIAKGAHQ